MNLSIILKMIKLLLNGLTLRKFKLLSLNRVGNRLYLIVVILILSSCGIAVHYYLNPPVKYTTLSFYHSYNNDPNYAIGYDFFYRIYNKDTTSESTIISEAKTFFTDTNLLELLFSNRNLITNSYFKRILPVKNSISTNYELLSLPIPTVNTPIMKIDPNYFDKDDSSKKFPVTFSISPSSGNGSIVTTGYIPSTIYPSTFEFARYVTKNNTDFELKTFLEIEESYDDIPILDGSNTIDIAFFVVLYGRTENYVPIFSNVVYIGSVFNLSF